MTMLPIRDVTLFTKVMGHGHPLLLMHGGPGLDHTTLSSLEPLADQFTLIFYDHRANGRSKGEADSMTWDNLTADADALRETLGYDRWAVLGHSFGGQVALEYALRYQKHLSQLLLLDTCGEAFWYAENAQRILLRRGYGEETALAAKRFFNGQLRPADVKPTVRKFLRAYFYHFGLSDLPHAVISAFQLKMRPDAQVFGFSTLLKDWGVMHRLLEIDVPTLLLAGRLDFLFPPEHQAILADRLPNAQLEIIEQAGHNAHAERPQEVLDIIRRFMGQSLAEQPPTGLAYSFDEFAMIRRAVIDAPA